MPDLERWLTEIEGHIPFSGDDLEMERQHVDFYRLVNAAGYVENIAQLSQDVTRLARVVREYQRAWHGVVVTDFDSDLDQRIAAIISGEESSGE